MLSNLNNPKQMCPLFSTIRTNFELPHMFILSQNFLQILFNIPQNDQTGTVLLASPDRSTTGSIVPSPWFSPDSSSRDFPFGSGTKKVKHIPKKLTTPKTMSEFFTPIPGGYPASVLLGSLLWEAYKNPYAPTIAPAFPAAADIPWQVDRSLAGKISAGTTNVVELGPKLAKKNVSEYITTNPMWLPFSVQ